MAKVIFSITNQTAVALRAIRAGKALPWRGRVRSLIENSLFERKLARAGARGLQLTQLGRCAVKLVDELARRGRTPR